MVDPRAFRDALSCYPTGVTLVATRHKGAGVAMTVNSFASVSLDPPLILWSVGRDTDRYEAFISADRFSVNILRDSQMNLAQHHAMDAAVNDRDWSTGEDGIPVLTDALAHILCETHTIHDGGDHKIIVGKVLSLDSQESGGALTFFRSRYGAASEDE